MFKCLNLKQEKDDDKAHAKNEQQLVALSQLNGNVQHPQFFHEKSCLVTDEDKDNE